jgi:hypothetical protein
MRPHPRSNILEVYSERERIQRNPVYQRISGVWDLRKQQLLIDSIINGLDLPKIYLHALIPQKEVDGHLYRYAIIDGKQRLEAIWSFMEDGFGLASDFEFFDDPKINAAGTRYSDLATDFPHLRARFDKTDLPIVAVQTDDEELVENLFSRLNEAVPLTAPEYRNTLGGPLPRVFRELATDSYFQECLPFETGRHRYLDLAAKFVYITAERKFVSTKKADLDNLVRFYKKVRRENRPEASQEAVSKLEATTRSTLSRMRAFFRTKDTLLANIGWITLYFHMFRLLDGAAPPPGLDRSQFEDFVAALTATRVELRRLGSGFTRPGIEPDPTLTEFVRLGQSSNDGSAILGRYRIVRRYFAQRFQIQLPPPEGEDAGQT